MVNEKIKQLVLFLFIGFQNYLFQMLYLVPKLIELGHQNAYLIPIYFMMISFILVIFVPKNNKDILKRTINNLWVKVPLIAYCFLASFFLVHISTIILSEYVFDNSMYYVFLVSLTLISLYLSYLGIRSIFHVFSFFAIIASILMVLPIIIVYPITDFSMILPAFFPTFRWFYLLIGLFLSFDSLLIYLVTTFTRNGVLRKTVILGNIFSFITLMIGCLLVIAIYGDKYYSGFPYIALSLFEIQESFKYVGNVDFVLCYILPVFTVFKVAYYFFLIRVLLRIKKKKGFILGLFLVYLASFVALFYFLTDLDFNVFSYSYYAFVLVVPFYLLLIIRRKKSEA